MKELFARLGVQVDTSSFAKADGMLKNMRNGFLALTAVGTGVAYALRAIVQGTADQAREIQRTARITGMGAEALQGLNYAAKVSGISAEELQHGLIRLAHSAREAAMHGGGAGLAYSQLGIRTANATGKMRPMNEIFAEVASKLSKMPDGTQKAALAIALFGRAGAQLIPLLDQGPSGISALTEEARKLGIVLDEKTLAAANRYRVTLDRLDGAVQGLKNSIAVKLLPVFQRATEQFIRWISVHRQWIALGIRKAFRDISQVVMGVVEAGKDLFHWFERIWNSSAIGKVAIVALGAAVVALTAPWLAFMAVLALVAEDVEGYFHGKDSITGRIVFALEKLWAKWMSFWDHIWDGIQKKGFLGFVYDEFATFFAWLTIKIDEIGPMIDALGERMVRAIPKGVLKVLMGGSPEEQIHLERMQRLDETGSPDVPRATPAERDSILGRIAQWWVGGPPETYAPYYHVDPKTGVGVGRAPSISLSVDMVVHADTEAGGRAAGKAAGDALVKHEDLNRMFREAAVGPMRQ